MNVRYLLITLAAVATLAFVACGGKEPMVPATPPSPTATRSSVAPATSTATASSTPTSTPIFEPARLHLTEGDSGRRVTVSAGTILSVDLEQIPGWRWQVREPLPSGVQFLGSSTSVPRSNGMPLVGGGSVEVDFRVTAVSAVIVLDLFAPYGPKDVPQRSWSVTAAVR